MVSYDISRGKNLIQTVLDFTVSIRPSMNFLLEYCAKSEDSGVWKKIADLDFEKDIAHLEEWFQKIIARNPPPESVRAFWFGVYHPVLNDGQISCALYFSGSPRFDPADHTATWAELKEDSYLPEGCYTQSAILDQLYYLTHEGKCGDLGDNILCLGYACLVAKSACRQAGERFLRGPAGQRPVAVGNADGEYLFIPVHHA